MKRNFVNLFLFVGILLSVSCSNQYNKIPVVGVTRSVKLSYKPRCIDIDMLMPTKCFMQQNRLVVFEPTTEQMFKVFNPSTMQLLYAFGNVGRADNEFAMQIYNEEITSIDKFEVYSAGKIKTVEFGEGSAAISHTKDFPLKAGSQPINRPRKIDDNTYFYDNMSVSNKTCEYVLFDIKTRTETYFSPLQQWCGKELNDVEYNMLYMRDSRYNPYQDKIAVVYHNFPVLKIIDRKSFDERLYRIDVEGFNPTKATGETIYFVEPYVTDNYIYVMWANTSKENAVREETDFTPHIFKFDWSGNMLANYELNYPIVNFTVSEQECKIYGTAIGDKDIRTIYEFEIPQDLTANGRMKHYENKYYAIDIPSTHQLSANDDSDKVQTNRKKGELWNANYFSTDDENTQFDFVLSVLVRQSQNQTTLSPIEVKNSDILSKRQLVIGKYNVTERISQSDVINLGANSKEVMNTMAYEINLNDVIVEISINGNTDLTPYAYWLQDIAMSFEFKQKMD